MENGKIQHEHIFPKTFLIDVTNRDGVQTSRLGLAKLEKTIINIMLNEAGIFQSEFGFPLTNHEINYINGNLELNSQEGAIWPMRLSGWLRAIPEDVNKAFSNAPTLRHVNVSASTSEQLIQGKFSGKKTFRDVAEGMQEAVAAAARRHAKTIGVNAEDASRTEISRLIDFGLAAMTLLDMTTPLQYMPG